MVRRCGMLLFAVVATNLAPHGWFPYSSGLSLSAGHTHGNESGGHSLGGEDSHDPRRGDSRPAASIGCCFVALGRSGGESTPLHGGSVWCYAAPRRERTFLWSSNDLASRELCLSPSRRRRRELNGGRIIETLRVTVPNMYSFVHLAFSMEAEVFSNDIHHAHRLVIVGPSTCYSKSSRAGLKTTALTDAAQCRRTKRVTARNSSIVPYIT